MKTKWTGGPGRSRRLGGGMGAALAVALLAGLGTFGACAKTVPLPPIDESARAHLPGKFVWHLLLTEEPGQARDYYGKLLGWTFENIEPGDDDLLLIKSGGRTLGAAVSVKGKGGGESISQWVSFLSVPDVKAAEAVFKGTGKVYRGAREVPGLGTLALVADPQGAPLGLIHTGNGDPPDAGVPAVGAFLWNDYVAADPGAALEFYAALVGWSHEVRDTRNGVDYHVFKSGGTPRAGLFRKPWPQVKPNWLPYVRVEDAAAVAARAEQLGGRVLLAPSGEVRNGSVAVVADPQGAAVALQVYPFAEEGTP